jgi:hypothetical protein
MRDQQGKEPPQNPTPIIRALILPLIIWALNLAPIIGALKPALVITDKILTPCFVDTHYYVWQTLLKGRHGDEMLLGYFVSGNSTPIETFQAYTFIMEFHIVSAY